MSRVDRLETDSLQSGDGCVQGVTAEGPVARRRIRLPSLRLRLSERRLLLGLVDTLIVNAALLLALILRTDFVVSGETLAGFNYWFITLTIVWLIAASLFSCYNLARAASPVHSVSNSAAAALATVAVYTAIPVVTPPLESRSLILLFAAFACAGIATWRLLYSQLFVQPWFEQRALVVGAGKAAAALATSLKKSGTSANPYLGTGYRLVGFLDDDPSYQGKSVVGIPVLGRATDLVQLAQELKVDEVILAITQRHTIDDVVFDSLIRCRELGIRVTTVSALYELLLGRLPLDHVGRDLQAVLPMDDVMGARLYRASKLLFDLPVALIGLLLLGILSPFVALANALTSPGPLFYTQQRVGRGGRCFKLFKFRTMIPDAEPQGNPIWAEPRDQRCSAVGSWLRRARLDELPQFINVLQGHMSVIGPRPERPEFVDDLAHQIPFYRARHAVRPGLTGWAQLRYDYGNSVMDAKIKLEYDLYYVKHASPLLDFQIFMQTIPLMLRLNGY